MRLHLSPVEAMAGASGAEEQAVARVGLLLRLGGSGATARQLEEQLSRRLAEQARQLPGQRSYLDHAAIEQHYGAAGKDIATVTAFAARHHLQVVEVNAEGRLVLLQGSLADLERAFSCVFETVTLSGRHFHRPKGPARLGAEIQDAVEGVYGLDDLPRLARVPRRHHLLAQAAPDAPAAPATSGSDHGHHQRLCQPQVVAQHYRFPAQATGKGQTIALVLLGGGVYTSDLQAFFGDRMPQLEVVEVAGGGNNPAPRDAIREYLRVLRTGQMPDVDPLLAAEIGWTLEATADVQLAGSLAPDARLVLYCGRNHELGELETFTTVLTDRQRDPQIVSCSWGTSESDVDAPYAHALDRIFQLAALRGVSLCFASGDRGPDLQDGQPTAHFPSSSPHVLSCGGTAVSRECLNSSRRHPVAETVWNEARGSYTVASGGGFSRYFPRPEWQPQIPADGGRGVPDVAAKADLDFGYRLILAGEVVSGGGTSSAVPLWASLLARCNQALGCRTGWLTPLLYGSPSLAGLRDISTGDNAFYQAAAGWDACTGWGSPDGEGLLDALRGRPGS